jgi:hypothetical protein
VVTYEVVADVRADLVDEYAHFMEQEHIPDVLGTGWFLGASLERAGVTTFRTRYVAASQRRLDAYLGSDTARLRAMFLAKFPEGVALTRTQWVAVHEWHVEEEEPAQ